MTNRRTQTPAEWLIEQYEHIASWDIDPDDWGRVVVQPLFRLKPLTDSGHPMKIIQADYRDTGRRFL